MYNEMSEFLKFAEEYCDAWNLLHLGFNINFQDARISAQKASFLTLIGDEHRNGTVSS
jgi:hypothetical protein